jgi:Mitochondrial pyruvate carriers
MVLDYKTQKLLVCFNDDVLGVQTPDTDLLNRLAAVNFFLFLANGTQVARIVSYQRSQSDKTIGEQAKAATQEVGEKIESSAKDTKAMAKEVVGVK